MKNIGVGATWTHKTVKPDRLAICSNTIMGLLHYKFPPGIEPESGGLQPPALADYAMGICTPWVIRTLI